MAIQKSGWFTTAAEEAELKAQHRMKRTLLEKRPDYQKHKQDTEWLCDLLSWLLFIDANEFSTTPSAHKNPVDLEAVAYRMGRRELVSAAPVTDNVEENETQPHQKLYREQEKFHATIRRYAFLYRHTQWNESTRDRSHVLVDFGEYNMGILRHGFKRGAASFDVGSSLYLFQQLHDREMCDEPSLSKAAWLVKNAPTRKPVPETLAPRGKWEFIQEQWKNNVETAHYWASFVALAQSPLMYSELLLFDFVCDVDIDQLRRLARTFYEFRQRARVPRSSSKKPGYLKQISSQVPNDLAGFEAVSPLDVPDPLAEFQWAVLSRYKTKRR